MIMYKVTKKDLSITPVEVEEIIGRKVVTKRLGITIKEPLNWTHAAWFHTEKEAAEYVIDVLYKKITEMEKIQERIDSLLTKYIL